MLRGLKLLRRIKLGLDIIRYALGVTIFWLTQQEGSGTPSAATAWAMTGGSTPTSASEDTRIPASGGSGVQNRPASNTPTEQVLTSSTKLHPSGVVLCFVRVSFLEAG